MIRALIKIRLRETFAYRAEFLLWLVTLTMPLVMLVFWRSVAREGAFQGYTGDDFNTYFLAVLVAALLTNCNSVWQVNEDIRTGELSFWLLRPIHPFVNYVAITVAELGLRLIIALPILVITLSYHTPSADARILLLPLALFGGLVINQAIHLIIGSLGFWIERSLVLHKLYATTSAVLSGYMFPIEFLPNASKTITNVMPFRFVISFPVEVLMGRHDLEAAVALFATQAAMAAALMGIAFLLWRRGVAHYSAFG